MALSTNTARPTLNRGPKRDRHALDGSHLLRFEPVPRPPRPVPAPRRSARSRQPVPHARERFIHAQYRFLLKPTGDYTVHFCDPDIHFDWSDVLQVIVPTSSALPFGASGDDAAFVQESATCPICLSEPTAPRMSRCGHVYCYPCILRYLELGDTGSWRKCPVCQDSIHSKDLKSVRWFDAAAAHQLVQDTSGVALPETRRPVLTMRLVARPQITTLGLPRSVSWPSAAVPPDMAPWHFTPDAEAFAHFMLASPQLLLDSLAKDLEQIQAEDRLMRTLTRAAGRGMPTDSEIGLVFVTSAKRKVLEQMDKAESLKTGAVLAARRQALRGLSDLEAHHTHSKLSVQEMSTSGSSDVEDVPDAYIATLRGQAHTQPASGPAPLKPRRNVNPPPPNDTTFMYYQVASGQNIFLSPLDTKILLTHYGDNPPPIVHIAVEHHEDKSMTADIRKRHKHLAHLPTASDVTFIEADLGVLVPRTALEPFAQQLKARRSQRTIKTRKEDRDLRASARKAAEQRAALVPEFRLPSEDRVIEMPALPTKAVPIPVHDPALDDDVAASPSSTAGAEAAVERTVWGTRAISSQPSPLLAATRMADHPAPIEEDDEHWRAFEAELALNRAEQEQQHQVESNGRAAGGGGGRRKKKGVTLSLSSGGRGR